jgi:hypothetical protein
MVKSAVCGVAALSIGASLWASLAFAQSNATNVHLNYNMGTAEYFVGSSDSGGFGFSCQDKTQEGYKARYLSAFLLPKVPMARGDKVVFTHGIDKVAVTSDDGENADFTGHKNWETFSRIWNMVRAGDEVSVAVNSHAAVKLSTEGAAAVMPATPCGE